MKIIPNKIMPMTTVLAGQCPHCTDWAGVIVKQYASPFEALNDENWPDLACDPVTCCERDVWPTHFLVIYQGEILEQKDIGGPDLDVRYKFD